MAAAGRALDPPRDLTIPAGEGSARAVLSRALGKLCGDLVAIARGEPSLGGLVAALMKENPGGLLSVIRAPSVGALIRCLRGGTGRDRRSMLDELVAVLALEVARMGALLGPVKLRRAPARLMSLPGRFVIEIPPDCSGIEISNGEVRIERSGSNTAELIEIKAREGSGPYSPIAGGIALSLVDNNPLAMLEAHPDKEGNAIDLGGRSAEEWVGALRAALAPIERHMPDLRAEMDLFIHQVIPVGWDAEKHLSASYQEAIGTIYLSLHPSLMTMTEALIHEFSHNKLNALFELDEVLENAWSPLYTSPVRPDPRPLHGVLLAVHAFLPVARLYERMIEAGEKEAENGSFRERFAQIRKGNREGASIVLTHGRPTAVGAGLLDEIRRWDAHFARWDEREAPNAKEGVP